MEEKEKSVYIVSEKRESVAVYSQVKDALDACSRIEDVEEIVSLDEYRRFSEGECTRLQVRSEATRVYILQVVEDKGGESYGSEMWQSVSEFKTDLISDAVSWYDDEHNREDGYDECKRCTKDKKECKERFIRRLRGRGYSKIACDYYATIYEVGIDVKEDS